MNVRPVQRTVESRRLVRKASIRAVCLCLLAERPAPADWQEHYGRRKRLRPIRFHRSSSILISISFGFTASYRFSAWRSRIGKGAA